MQVADLEGRTLDYWVARGLHDFVREIHFTDSGETVAVRGNDRGRPWDGRFMPSASRDAAAVVLERARRIEMRERSEEGPAYCVAEFEGGNGSAEGRADTVRVALLRAFVKSRFGESVGDMLHEPQMLIGDTARRIEEATAGNTFEDVPSPEGHIGDIQSPPRP